MKIVSKFKDFYDIQLAYGSDQDLIFVRHRDEVEANFKRDYPKVANLFDEYKWGQKGSFDEDFTYRQYRRLTCSRTIGRVLLLFCTKVYLLYYISDDGRKLPKLIGTTKTLADDFVTSFSETLGVDSSMNRQILAYADKLRNYPKPFDLIDGSFFEYQEKHKSPILAFHQSIQTYGNYGYKHTDVVVVNPKLEDYRFHKLVNPAEAFQEVSMFLSNQLVKSDDGPKTVGSDEVIAKQKGFDEMSFRTVAPGAKKINRKLNKQRKKGVL